MSNSPTRQPADTGNETPLAVFAMVSVSVVANAVLMTMPLLLGATMDRLGFSAKEAASIPAADMLGASISALIGSLAVSRMPWKTVLAWAIGVRVLADCASGLVSSSSALFACRIVGGLCGGLMLTIANASIAETRRPDRYYALSTATQLAFGAIALMLLPWLLEAQGLRGAFWTLGTLAVLVLPLIRRIPAGPRVRSDPQAAGIRVSRQSILGLSGLLALYIAQGGVWSFLDRIGADKHIDPAYVAQALSLSSIAGMSGALLSSWLEVRFGRLKPLAAATLVMAASVLVLRGSTSFVAFAAIVSLFSFAWYFSVAYQFGALAVMDPTRRTVGLGGFVAFGGLTLGPVIAAAVVGDHAFSRIIWTSLCFSAVGLGLFTVGFQRTPEVTLPAAPAEL